MKELGLIGKLKVCWFILANPAQKNMLITTCEFCESANVKVLNSTTVLDKHDNKIDMIYKAKYLCMECKSSCEGTQVWSRYTDEYINEIIRKLKGL